ncbi:MAG: peptidase M61, partial [Gammaproteobacteria bacterium]
MITKIKGTADQASSRIPPPRDIPYPGTIKLAVDASDTSQGIFRAHEIIPVAQGTLILLYPKWIPAFHEPSGPIAKLAGISVSANGKSLAWTRDKYDVYVFRIEVPQGVTTIELDYQYLSPRGPGEGPIEMTGGMLNLMWHAVALYPAGHYSRGITYEVSVRLPSGWQYGTALETQSRSGDVTFFKPTTFNTLVDSPLYAGRYFKRVDLAPGAKVPVHMD